MHKLRSITVGLGALALLVAASAHEFSATRAVEMTRPDRSDATAPALFDSPAPLAWRFLQPTSVPPGGSPLAVGDLLYQSIGGRIFCIEKQTGNLVWRFPQLDPIEGAFRNSPVLAGGSILATGDNKIVYAIDPATGAQQWSQVLPQPPLGHPVIVNDAYVTSLSDNSLIALKISDGSPLWGTAGTGSSDTSVYKVYDGLIGRISVSGGDVLYFTGKDELVSFNVGRRTPTWHQRFDQLPPNPVATVTKEAIYLNSGPFLITLNPATGIARWQVNTNMQLILAPVATATGVLVVSEDGHAQVYDPLRHLPLLKKPIAIGSVPIELPTAVGSDFIVLTANGAINLIDPTKPDAQWIYVIKPLVETVNTSRTTQNGAGGGPGSRGAPGGGGGQTGSLGGAPGGPGGPGGQTKTIKITFIQASAPAILAGQTLIVPARDGSILAFDKSLGVDLTPPTVDMVFPNPGDQVSGQPPLFLLFKVADDNSGLKTDSIKVTANGQPLDFTLDTEGQIIVRFSLTGKNHPLSDGRKAIVVTASDWMGNVAQKSFSLTIDNALRPLVLPNQNKNQPGLGGGPGAGGGGGNDNGGGGGG